MKTWEKILLYPIGLYLWLTDGIKKMSKKWKPAMAMLMAVVMLCGMLPATAIAGTNDDEADLLERLGVEGEVQLAELDGGKYIAVYLDDDDSRDSYNNQAAYYAIYDGIWQRPYILEDDGTKDYMPTISDLGNGQLFIAWGTASKTFDANTKEYAALNATDIVGVFVDKATGNISEVLEVTYETEDDVYGDENPRAAYDEATGRLMIWYNKCEYSDESDPYSVLSYRLYDMQVKEFLDLGDSPDGDWYGQVLVGVDPVVTVEETLDASGYWAETPEFTEFDGWDSCAVEFDAIQFNGQSLLAYVIDYDLNRSTTDDRDVYVLAYNFDDNSITHPIMITNTDAAESNVEFRDVDGKLCLSYLSDGQEITFNISDNFSNANVLREGVTDDGVFYYYISKSADSGYIPATVAVFNISYLDKDGQEQICEKCTSVGTGTAWTSGWYYVGSDITISDRITVTGDVHLILGDGATLSATKGITVETDNSLTIYAQSTGENMGKLVAGSQSDNAAIGGAYAHGGNITINGGDIQATGGTDAAGIGGGYNGVGGNIVINGGTVTAYGGTNAAGIGGGKYGNGGNITISGGTVTAYGGLNGAGIGSGASTSDGNITISGGTVTANGGNYGAGIGGGYNSAGGNITISGGTVTANGGNYGAGIGGGRYGGANIVRVYTSDSSLVNATGGIDAQSYGNGSSPMDGKYCYNVAFDSNGGSGDMGFLYISKNYTYAFPECRFTAPSNKTFKAWSVGGEEKQPGDKITISADTTVAAVWEILHTCSITPVEKVWPSCENSGKEAYYKCEGCEKNFEDAAGTIEITDIDSWGIIDKLGHAKSGWKTDGTHHWKTCTRTICAVVIEGTKGEHTSTGNNVATCTKLAKCDICGVSYGDFAGHDWNTASWEKDATGHWHKCNTAICAEKKDFAAHTPDHQGGATEEYAVKCAECLYEIEAQLNHTHVFDKQVADEQYKVSGATCTEPAKYYVSCACGEKGADTFENGAANGHTAGTEWKSDGDNHWHICTVADCGAVIESSKAAHTSTGDNVATCQKKAVCDVCGVTYGDFADHDWNTASWEKDATGHWYKCNTADCTEKKDFAEHTPDHDGGATEEYAVKCAECLYEIEAQLNHTHVFDKQVADERYKVSGATCTEPAKYYVSCACGEKGADTFENGAANGHTEGTEWKTDGEHHWHICTVADCGAVIESSKAAHTSTGDNVATCQKKAVCDVCGVTYGDFADHDWNTFWEKDATGHWYKCNTAECAEKKDFAEHTPDHDGGATEEYPIKCTACGWIIEQQLGHTHIFDKEVAQEQYLVSKASCNEPAKYYISCVCGQASTEIFEYGTANGHTEGATWQKNATHHWHICTTAGCGAIIDTSKVAHTPDHKGGATEEYAIKCTGCGYVMEAQLKHTHVFNKKLATEQYLASRATCTEPAKYYISCGCGMKGTATFTSGKALGHIAGTAWEKDATGHWHICTAAGCGAIIDTSKAAHTPDRDAATETDPIKCSACGYVIAPALGHTHTHGADWKSDRDNHWNECACGNKANTAAHKDNNNDGKCDTCGYNVGLPADPDNSETDGNGMMYLWIILICVGVVGAVAATILIKKKSAK